MSSKSNKNNISCSVCGVPLDQPSPLCKAYAHPDPVPHLPSELLSPSQVPSEWQPSSWPEVVSKTEISADKWHDHTMKALVLPSKWDVEPLPPSPEEIKAQQIMYQFVLRIERMNLLFQIGAPSQLTNLGLSRLQQFKMVINDEVSEGRDLILQIITRLIDHDAPGGLLNAGSQDSNQRLTEDEMVAFADWLGDLVVYVFSEAVRWGIDLLAVLKVIMDSQDSKLGPDGQPIHDPATNKFLKGPNYVAPEAAIKNLLFPVFGIALEDSKPREDGLHRQGKSGPAVPYVKLSPIPIYTEIGDRQGWSSDVVEDVKHLGVLANDTATTKKNNPEKSCSNVDTPTDKT